MKFSFYLFLLASLDSYEAATNFWRRRSSVLSNEASQLLGSSIKLTKDEQKVNGILMNLKMKEYDRGFADPSKFLPSVHFFKSKEAIEQSEVFKFIQKVPKGASLHSHSTAMLSLEGFLNLTYMDGLYGCDHNGTFHMRFFFGEVDKKCKWKLLSDLRSEDPEFDHFLRKKLTLIVDDPDTTYNNANIVWRSFEKIFSLISPLFRYRRFLHSYLYQVLQEFYDDNVRYLEIRGSFPPTFDSNNTVYNTEETLQLYQDTTLEFQKKNPSFLGLRLIYARSRHVNKNTMASYISTFLDLLKTHPDLIAGFDLVGQEDLGQPLSAFADQLVNIANLTKFFFHAGETNWYGSSTDLNLVTAVLLNTTRIGHAFAITKHPEVLEAVKQKNIAIELNPISNQVLRLVNDLRNHAGAYLISQGYPVVITCDDPTVWGAKGLSYDWYMAFMAMTPRCGDLRILKQFALNSFLYSSLDEEIKSRSVALLKKWWDEFIHEVLSTYR